MTEESEAEGIRLQKVLAAAGIASRRASEELIVEGRVEVNGKVVTELGTRVHPESDAIRVDGARIPTARRHVYVVLNKPKGVVSTMDDPEGRANLSDYLGRRKERLFHVGRLDHDTEGLLLLTNDGEFAHRLQHPRYEVSKTYIAEVEGFVENPTLKQLSRGVMLEDGPIKPDEVKLLQRTPAKTMIRFVLHSGRNRIVRRMMDRVGHPVTKLARTEIGPVRLGMLAPGELRELTREELGALLEQVGM